LAVPLAVDLVRLGFLASHRFAAGLAPLGLEPRQFGMLVRLAEHDGVSQRELAQVLDLHPTRVVFVVDELEAAGLAERRRSTTDRRSNAISLTAAGRRALARGQAVGRANDEALGTGLTAKERAELERLLAKVAVAQGLPDGGLPGPPPGVRRSPAAS
jgi:DNA-binding MarR family transcriptional regulator